MTDLCTIKHLQEPPDVRHTVLTRQPVAVQLIQTRKYKRVVSSFYTSMAYKSPQTP